MKMLNRNQPYTELVGQYELYPTARYEQAGEFFALDGVCLSWTEEDAEAEAIGLVPLVDPMAFGDPDQTPMPGEPTLDDPVVQESPQAETSEPAAATAETAVPPTIDKPTITVGRRRAAVPPAV